MDSYAEDEAGLRQAIGMALLDEVPSGPSLDLLQTAFEAVEQADFVGEDYEAVVQAEPMTHDRGVKTLLQNLSVQLGVDLEEASREFQARRNPSDKDDLLDVG